MDQGSFHRSRRDLLKTGLENRQMGKTSRSPSTGPPMCPPTAKKRSSPCGVPPYPAPGLFWRARVSFDGALEQGAQLAPVKTPLPVPIFFFRGHPQALQNDHGKGLEDISGSCSLLTSIGRGGPIARRFMLSPGFSEFLVQPSKWEESAITKRSHPRISTRICFHQSCPPVIAWSNQPRYPSSSRSSPRILTTSLLSRLELMNSCFATCRTSRRQAGCRQFNGSTCQIRCKKNVPNQWYKADSRKVRVQRKPPAGSGF